MIKKYIWILLVLPFLTNAQVIEFESSITPDLSGYPSVASFAGLGEYEIFLDTDNGVLDKPIILVDGFDPGDGRTIPGLYSLLDFTGSSGSQNLADLVRAEGFDVVVLNFPAYLRLADNSLLNLDDVADTNGDMIIDEIDFPAGSTLIDGGADFMERNAMLLVDLINTLNAVPTVDEELVIIGPSMGGLISRFALNYMENDTAMNGAPPHETRLWISFDSPHHGANVPIGLQHQLNVLAFGLQTTVAGDNSIVELQPLINSLLKSPAARQLLVDHLESHLATGSAIDFDPALLLPEAHPYKAIFDASINSLTSTGFPETTRNVAIINGSGIGNPYQDANGADISPGFALINESINLAAFTELVTNVAFSPLKSTGTASIGAVSFIDITFFGGSVLTGGAKSADSQGTLFSDGVDAVSGGLFDISALTAGLDTSGVAGDFLNAFNSNAFSFIPSVSGMALEITNSEVDWYHNIDLGDPDNNGDTLNETPFVNWYMPDDNENHVQLTELNVAFALNEIIPETLSNSAFESENLIKIERNPIDSELVILSGSPINEVTIVIIDITGKIVYNTNFNSLSSRTVIPLNLDSGLYVLNLVTKDNLKYRTKILVK